jgi:hypothetical protein
VRLLPTRSIRQGGGQFYSLAPVDAPVDTDGQKLVMAAQLSQLLAMVWATSNASPAAVTTPKGAVDLGEALQVVVLARIVVKRCHGDEVWSWVWRWGKVA